MANAVGIIVKYIALPGILAYSLMQIFKPSEAEIQKIKTYSKTNDQFSAVLQAAASPNAKPMYRQKPGEQHPVPELAKNAKR